jgi:hypothetical protein
LFGEHLIQALFLRVLSLMPIGGWPPSDRQSARVLPLCGYDFGLHLALWLIGFRAAVSVGDQVAVAVDLTEGLFALRACSWAVCLVQIVAVFPFIFGEGLATDAAELAFHVPLPQFTVFQRLKELGDIPARPAETGSEAGRSESETLSNSCQG